MPKIKLLLGLSYVLVQLSHKDEIYSAVEGLPVNMPTKPHTAQQG